ncbi:MAG TPA: hypothetical protein VF723_07640 [Pyrinomonadaceae bacterium]|jgi:uncharacterized protein (TIGR03437 family)
MDDARLRRLTGTLLVALMLTALWPGRTGYGQRSRATGVLKPDVGRALRSRVSEAPRGSRQKDGQDNAARESRSLLGARPRAKTDASGAERSRPARLRRNDPALVSQSETAAAATGIRAGTPLGRILHTSQLSLTSAAGTDEQYVDRDGNLVADERRTFDADGGSFDIAVGRSGARYEVYSAIDDNNTSATGDDVRVGVLVVGRDTNGDYVRDSASTYDLERYFGLPSAISVVSGTSRAGREFVIASSSGYYNFDDPHDPDNEISAGVALLVGDNAGGFDLALSRSLVRAGGNELNNANALTLLPNNDLLIADLSSYELRIVRDTNADGIPDTLDPKPYYSYQYSTDAPLDIAANSRGVVFSHSFGNDTILLALYDTDNDGYAETERVCIEGGLSIDNRLVFHGLTVDREGTVYVIENAAGAADVVAEGGNLGSPQIDAFPDPALNGILRDGAVYTEADAPKSQALSGLCFGVNTVLGPVRHLTMVNSASLRGAGTRDGLASILGTGLTRGASGRSTDDAASSGVSVSIEGRRVPVLSFDDGRINIYLPDAAGTGVGSVVVTLNGEVTAGEDVSVVNDNPGLFTHSQTGAGEVVALLVSGMRYTSGPFAARTDNQPTVIALFGTGWRNSLPVAVRIGGQAAVVEYAGPAGGFPGLDQINVRIPDGASGTLPVVVTTSSGAKSREDALVTIK